MRTRDFDFELPPAAIAQEPVPRGTSRLLVLDADGPDRHRRISDLPSLLAPGDLLVVNDTRVLPARLQGRLPDGAPVELLLVEARGDLEWKVLGKPGRKLRPGVEIELIPRNPERIPLAVQATVASKGEAGLFRVRFSAPVEPWLEDLGHVPLPPYIKRPAEPRDRERYQTVFSRVPGAIAAPTAGLHFTPELLAAMAERGVRTAALTLHVGIGTFKPVSAELVHEHRMERERYEIPPATAQALGETRAGGGRVVAVGTTVVRTLEAAALAAAPAGGVAAGPGSTALFITPGFPLRVVDLLLTNFHLPRSTLLMLVCAAAGRERVLAAYREAIREGYRFYSYGDAMLVRCSPLSAGSHPGSR